VKGRFSSCSDLCKDPHTKPDLASFNAGSPSSTFTARARMSSFSNFVMVHQLPGYGLCGQLDERMRGEAGAGVLRHRHDQQLYFPPQYRCSRSAALLSVRHGSARPIPATVDNLIHMVRSVPQGAFWSVCATGLSEWPMITAGILLEETSE